MSLTKQDLQEIRTIVKEEVKAEVSEQLKPVHKELTKHSKELEKHSKILAEHTKEFDSVKKTLSKHSKDLKYLRKTSNLILEYVDEEDAKLRRNVERIERQLGLA